LLLERAFRSAAVSVASVAALALFFSVPEVLATPTQLFSLGPESQALGKTGVSGVSDFGAVVLNPAALAARRRSVWFGYDAARFSPTVQGDAATGPVAPPAQPAFVGGVLGLRLPITPAASGFLSGLTLGLAVTSPRDVIVRAQLPLPETPQFPLLSARAQALDLALSLAFQPLDALRLGVGLRGLAGLEGQVQVAGDGQRDGVENELSLELAPIVGVLFQARQQSVGLVYRGALAAPFEVELRDQSVPGITLPPLHLDGLAHYDPAEFGLEWSREFAATRVSLGLVYQRWSAFEGWLGQTVTCSESPCGALPLEAIELSDTLSPRLGVARRVALSGVDLTLRLGYAFEPTPLPEQSQAANRWDNQRSLFTCGYEVELRDTPFAFAAAYQFHWLHERTHRKAQPELEPAAVTVAGSVHFFALDAELRF
jgi:hypothetical protein